MRSLVPEIEAFIRTVELGSFAAVAAETGYTASGVSRMISRLEDGLGAKLLHRSTRSLTLTPEGELFLDRARNILLTVEAAATDVSQSTGTPSGFLRINSGTAFAHHVLARKLPDFHARYPEISTHLGVTDRRIDPIAERVDATIRVGKLTDSDLVAVRFGTVRRIIAASPAYLACRGYPETIQDLGGHDCLLLAGFPKQAIWPMLQNGRRVDVKVRGAMTSDSADALLQAAIGGGGLVRLGDFLGTDALFRGQLVPVLSEVHFDDPQPITVLIQPGRQKLPRVRAFLDFLKALEFDPNPRVDGLSSP